MVSQGRLGFGIFLCLCAAVITTGELAAQAQTSDSALDLSGVPPLQVEITTITVKGDGGFEWTPIQDVEGDLWAFDPWGKCFRVDTSTSPAIAVRANLKKAYCLALGFGSLWSGVPRGPDAGIHRLDPKTYQEIAKIDVAGSVFITEDSVWVVRAHFLYRVNPLTNQITAKIDAGKDIATMTVAEGSVWVLRKTGILSRIDLGTNQSLAEIPIGQRRMERLDFTNYYSNLVIGEGAVWITEHIADGKVIKVDTKTNQVVARIRVGPLPESIVVGGGFVWVSIYFTNTSGHCVLKIDPQTDQILGKIFLAGTQPHLSAGKDGLLACGSEMTAKPFGIGARMLIWKIPY
jgi:hypothetical protein